MASEASTSEVEHQHDVGEEFEAPHKGTWKVTNRMVDVDTGEALYRLRELGAVFDESEILTEGQVSRIYGEDTPNTKTDQSEAGQ